MAILKSQVKNHVFIKSVAALVAATIGAGIFGIPYVMSQAGAVTTLLWMLGLMVILIINNLLLGEVALRMPDSLRFIGLVKTLFGKKGSLAVQILTVINYFAVLVAYLLIGSRFLQTILSLFLPINGKISLFIYFAVSAAIIFVGLKFIEKLDVFTVSVLVGLIGLLTLIAAPHVQMANLSVFSVENIFLPYGVILFALSSAQIIPTLEAALAGNKHLLKKTIITGGVIATAVTAIFGLAVAGVSGPMTSQDAVSGLAAYLGNSIIILGSLIGLLAIFGVHTSLGNTTKEIFQYDFGMSKIRSWILIVSVPMLIVLLSNVNFISALSFIGGVLSGIMGIVIGLLSIKASAIAGSEPEYHLKYSRWWAYLIMIIFFIGALYEIYFSFLK